MVSTDLLREYYNRTLWFTGPIPFVGNVGNTLEEKHCKRRFLEQRRIFPEPFFKIARPTLSALCV